MVGRGYEVAGLLSPSFLRRWFDQKAIPAAIDGVATVELALQQVAERAERRPLPLLGVAILFGAAMALCPPRRTFRR